MSQYSSTHIFYFLPGVFIFFLVVVKHSELFIYTRYIIQYVLEHFTILYTRGTYIRGIYVQQYTWYPGIIRCSIIFITRYLFGMCATDVHLVLIAGMYDDVPSELSNQEIAGTLFLHVHF